MKNIIKKSITAIVILALTLTLAIPMQTQAAAKVKLNKTNAVLTITNKKAKPAVQLKVIGASKKATWTSSNKKVATVNKKGKVTARKKGTVVVRAKVNRRIYECTITVRDKRTKNNNNNNNNNITSHEHDYFKSSWFSPTCDLDGEVNYCCSICYDKYTEVIPATGHNYVEVSQGVESYTGRSVTKYHCTKCDRSYTQYTGPLIDYKKPHIHCHCGMDFDDHDEHIIHSFYALQAGEINGHSSYNWSCCMVTGK